jgi:hypothetical protein
MTVTAKTTAAETAIRPFTVEIPVGRRVRPNAGR